MNKGLEFAAALVCGERPAGGPFVVEVHDGQRFRTSDYRIRVRCTEYPEDGGEPRLICEEQVRPSQWTALLRAAVQ